MIDCRVLVVEDDKDTCDAIVELLRMEGYDAQGAGDGKQALDILRAEKFQPDVIVLDLYMPTMNGQELRRMLQAEPHWANIPVVLCSGTTGVTDSEGAFETLSKPMEIEELLAVVRRGCAAGKPYRKLSA
jgi:CheY-like chemotaxis protein